MYKIEQYNPDHDVDSLKQIIEEFAKFTENEIYPYRAILDEKGVHLTPSGVKVHESLHKLNHLYHENGWFGLGVSENLGGTPIPESIASACVSLATGANPAWMLYPGLSKAAFNVIKQIGSTEQKNQLLPPMMKGEWGGTMCLTENGAGSDVGALRTTAEPDKNVIGKYRIKGVKIFISSGENDLYKNIIHLVLARTPGAPQGTKGLSLFVVPRFKINPDGSLGVANDVKCTKIEEKMGIHGSATCELTFGENNNCEGFLIGKELEGMTNMFVMMNEARLACAIQGESQANLALKLTEQYVHERVQFSTPIINHPDVKRMIFKLRALSRGLRSICLMTSTLFDRHEQGDAECLSMIEVLTPICKSFCTDEGFNVCVDTLQLHGGYGYCKEYGLEQFVRDAKIATIYEGTNAIQAKDFVMRKILRDNGQTFLKLVDLGNLDLKLLPPDLFSEELTIYQRQKPLMEKCFQMLASLAAQKQIDGLLVRCTDFLNMSSHLLVSYCLAKGARVAHEKLKQFGENHHDAKFWQSKILDFKVFCHHYLTKNFSLAETILNSNLKLEEKTY